MGIRAVERIDGAFELKPEVRILLHLRAISHQPRFATCFQNG
jgi:hypothetical protein